MLYVCYSIPPQNKKNKNKNNNADCYFVDQLDRPGP